MKPPFSYEENNLFTSSHQPSTVHVKNTGLANFFKKYLIEEVCANFKFGLPDTWPLNYFLYTLYLIGYIAVVNTDKYGVIPQLCSLRGYNVFYQPTNAVISNPLLRGILTPRIGEECTLIRIQPDYTGIFDIVSYYGDQMALAAESFGVNLFNSKLAYLFTASNNTLANSFKKAYDTISSGTPAVVVDKNLTNAATGQFGLEIIGTDKGQFDRIPQLLQVLHQLEIMFDQTVGIPNVSTTKRERELESEMAINETATRTLASLWLDEMRRGVEETNAMFNLNISVDWRWKSVAGDNLSSGSL